MILVAVEAYVRTQITVAENQDIVIDFKAGRGENGITATLDIVPAKLSGTFNKVKPVVTRQPDREPEADVEEPEEALKPKVKFQAGQSLVSKDPEPTVKSQPKKKASQLLGISTGEDREDPEDQYDQEEALENQKAEDEEVAADDGDATEASDEDEAPKPKPRSIFSKAG